MLIDTIDRTLSTPFDARFDVVEPSKRVGAVGEQRAAERLDL